jgi:hypothetical protein
VELARLKSGDDDDGSVAVGDDGVIRIEFIEIFKWQVAIK